jgi:hypothetical protein
MNKRLQVLSMLAGGTLAAFCAMILMVTAAFWSLGVEIGTWNLPLAAGAAAVTLAIGVNRYVKGGMAKAGAFAFLLAFLAGVFWLAVSLAGAFYDVSYDGQGYHMEAVMKLHDGWNPFYDPFTGNVWNDHYAKGAEIMAASLYALTGQIEQGKAFNFLLLTASFLLAFAGLLTWDRQIWRALVAAGVLAFNPVVINQTLTFYIDGQLGALLLCLLGLGTLLAVRADGWTMLTFALALISILNNKFTGVVYAVVLCGGLLLLVWVIGKRGLAKALTGVMAAAFLVGVLLVGFHPYVINTLEKGHPLYPVAGPGKIDIMDRQVPGDLVEMPSWKRLAVSVFARSENVLATGATTQKTPFTWTKQEIDTFVLPDARIGGFGPLFGGAVLMGTLLVALAFWLIPRRQATLAALVIAVVLVSVLVNPESWWARFAPQLWLVPALVGAYGLVVSKSRVLQVFSLALLFVMAANVWMTSREYYEGQREMTATVEKQLSALERFSQEQPVAVVLGTPSSARRFEEHGVRFQRVQKLPCDDQLQLPATQTMVCRLPEWKEKAGE